MSAPAAGYRHHPDIPGPVGHMHINTAVHVAVIIEQGLHQIQIPRPRGRVHMGGATPLNRPVNLGPCKADHQIASFTGHFCPGRPAFDIDIGAKTAGINVATDPSFQIAHTGEIENGNMALRVVHEPVAGGLQDL